MEDTAASEVDTAQRVEAHGAGGTREIRAIYDDRLVRVYQAYNAVLSVDVPPDRAAQRACQKV